jgi:hypothetical protein
MFCAMTSEQNNKAVPDGGPAFPVSTIDNHTEYGMSLRDWFAGQAMNQQFSVTHIWDEAWIELAAKKSYAMADAMLKARQS